MNSRTGSSFKGAATSFAAGAAGGVAAYAIMRSMSGPGGYRSRPEGYYGAGYGGKIIIDLLISNNFLLF